MQTRNTHTGLRTTHEAQGSSRRRRCFFFFFTGVALTLPGQRPKVVHTTHTSPLHLKTKTKFLRLHFSYVFLSPEPQRPRLQNCPDLTRPHQTSPDLRLLSPTFLQRPSSSPVRVSLSSKKKTKNKKKNSPQELAKLHRHVALTSHLEWHNGYNLSR